MTLKADEVSYGRWISFQQYPTLADSPNIADLQIYTSVLKFLPNLEQDISSEKYSSEFRKYESS